MGFVNFERQACLKHGPWEELAGGRNKRKRKNAQNPCQSHGKAILPCSITRRKEKGGENTGGNLVKY